VRISFSQPCFTLVDSSTIHLGIATLVTDSGYICYPFADYTSPTYKVEKGFISFNGQYTELDSFAYYPYLGDKMISLKRKSGGYILLSNYSQFPYPSNQIEIKVDMNASNADTTDQFYYGAANDERFTNANFDEDSAVLNLLSLWEHPNTHKGHPIYSQFDSLGQLLNRFNLYDGRSMALFTVNSTVDGCYLFTYGFKPLNVPGTDCGVMKVNALGEVLWRREEIRPGQMGWDHALKLRDNSFIRMLNPTQRDLVIEHLDAKGELLATWASPYTNDKGVSDGEFTAIHELADGCILFHFLVKDSVNGTSHPSIAKYDPFGTLLWQRTYVNNPEYSEQFQKLNITQDKGYLMTGFTRTPDGRNNGWAMKVDCLGYLSNEPPAECSEFDCEDYPIDAFFTASDTLLDLSFESGIVQFNNNTPNHTSIIWFFKDGGSIETIKSPEREFTQNGVYEVELQVYVSGCKQVHKQNIHVINAPLSLAEQPKEASFSIFPNPSDKGIVSLRSSQQLISEIHLLDEAGKQVKEITDLNTKEFALDLSELSSGIYLVSVNFKNGQNKLEKVILKR
jgi:hypothetical protein